MNIFCLDEQPNIAAQYHCDKHVIKMILEQCQILSTAHRVLDGKQNIVLTKTGRKSKQWTHPNPEVNSFIYKSTHVNHPSTVWACETYLHYQWLVNLTKELCKEYTYRYGKVHKCERIGLVDWFSNNYPKNIDCSMKFRLPTPAMPDDAKVKGDVVSSYRNYYNKYKQRMLSWSGKVNSREVPQWINQGE